MSRAPTVLFSVTLFAVGMLACGGPTVDNVAECKAAYEKANAAYAECGLEEPFDLDEICPASLNDTGGDCTDLYQCIGESYACVDGGLNADEVSDCPSCS